MVNAKLPPFLTRPKSASKYRIILQKTLRYPFDTCSFIPLFIIMFKITQLRNCGINACTVVEKNVWISERFFDNHYNRLVFTLNPGFKTGLNFIMIASGCKITSKRNHYQRNDHNEIVSKNNFFPSNNYDNDNNIWGSNWQNECRQTHSSQNCWCLDPAWIDTVN